ncbi:DUF742 domain-containing protein [Actinacidiphila oryziradicis]|jgi:hypothetical protein|uniref:DUF742 domain-containing protein n=1 Tax=Actinacidiphila oryziradicis TaxID=2571141 RepID=A0A4U0SGW7_9ACTN|nr:DUF742 domain-containing protein [Actinacidiphila oryziradicis]MCW2875129.1 cvnC4 [Actinacidiphila oryziradicis]TKA08880.1 DUF742 domain-containing protein [Actinacidiphila oryziradicis]
MTAGDTQADGDAVSGLAADPVGRAPAVRPFLVTAGRVAGTRAGTPMPLETQVVSTAAGIVGMERLAFERRDIVALCRHPQSLAEVAARLRLHLNVVRVLAEDLESTGDLSVYVPRPEAANDLSVLRRVIDGLRTIPDFRETTP